MLHNGERTITKENNQYLNPGKLHDGAYAMGIIDTGGASSQISYLPKHSYTGNAKTKIFGEKETNIVARSFLNYGMYASRSIVEGNVIEKCLNDIHCDTNNIINPCFSYNHTQHNSYNGNKYEVSGGGDFDACYEEVYFLFIFYKLFINIFFLVRF